MLLEICANSIESALNAQNGGADRIELCTHLEVGGLTPSHGLIKVAKELLNIPIYVLIRPRAGDFMYSKIEMEVMKEDVQFCAEMGCAGVVIGCLNADRTICWEQTEQLLEKAGYMDVTFHRAFDQCPNPFEALETLREMGIQRVLTSGCPTSAIDGVETLGELVDEADDDIIVMPGGGIRPENLKTLLQTGASEYHSSAIPKGEYTTSVEMVKAMKSLLK
ncbi:MAG: copper homeostasis protein CutC [Cytophagales bacterium CG12_big_fil_rev_8_21_14_0_65_40_12]|nr:MAG: copper homeostasis protein CutC [Cytophagales bacterium CG12_big_fil_rev_8_21_14_0_65_40_12]PIW04013.1 MAG: copper homeostasis protein CutC [Cytophagales bacterium CG17_big_fil_post_rev_8_21_14_2_50_40_13]